jgi:hypothetical protein
MDTNSLTGLKRRGSIRWAAQPARSPRDDNIDRFASRNPEPVTGERGNSREFAADTNGLDRVRRCIRYRKPSLPNPKDPVGGQRGPDVGVNETALHQIATPGEHTERSDR